MYDFDEESRSKIKNIIYLLITTAFLTVVIPSAILYGAGAVEDEVNLVSFFFYSILALISSLVAVFMMWFKATGVFDKIDDKYRGFALMDIHDTSHSYVGSRIEFIRDARKLILASLVFGILFGMMVMVGGTFATGVPTFTEGQLSNASELVLSVEPAVWSETLFFNMFVLWGTTGLVVYLMIDNFDVDFEDAVIPAKVIGFIVSVFAFWIYHNFRYGAEETSQIAIFLLGFLTNFVTVVTGSVIPAYFIHAPGNFFDQLNRLGVFTDEIAIFYTIISAVSVVTVYILLFEPFDNGGVV